ncbi:50S ribosomal protein L7/L12 [Streptococcus agalactiae]|uniref:50S ribosomal protein L7/L12 n=4 Tax=Bacilli TaxID=91061 RepID=UPI00123CE9A7|nr:50S ribosomal protein L7/L12 [Streptococcus agalactiae]KAA9073635.1 50S ribosomal protein L7/L12 [Streptococcus agalactiae]
MALNIENIIAEIKEATILELNDLVKAIEEEFGVTAAAPVAAAAAGGEAAAAKDSFDVELTAAKDSFDVELTAAGDKKVGVIKVVREITGEGLKEAKAIVDNAPSVIKEGASEAEANEIKEKLEAAGASVTLK